MTDRELMQKVLSFLETNYLVMCSQFHMQRDMLADDLRKQLAQPDQWQGLTDDDREDILRWIEWKEIGSQPVAPQKLIAYVEKKLKERNA